MDQSLSRRSFIGAAGVALVVVPNASAGSTIFHYDSLGRLSAALSPDGALNVYNYDKDNNITSFREPYLGAAHNINDECFDLEYYEMAYPSVLQSGFTAYNHFCSTWQQLKYNPSSYFHTSGYLSAYPDVAAAGINPLWQYMVQGWREGRDPSPLFSTQGYLSSYLDVASANINPLWHFMKAGYYEGRKTFGTGGFTAIY